MGSSATAQINVRLDRALKEAGDAELARLGISPSQAVRALWEKLSQGGEEAASTKRALLTRPVESPEHARKLAALERYDASWQAFDAKLRAAGIDPSGFKPLTCEELEEARSECLLEKYGA